MENVYLEYRSGSTYPQSEFNYSPSCNYPEYPFPRKTLAKKHNEIYDMVRTALYGLGLDIPNYQTDKWNPLGDMLPIDGTVVLKPNWVNHINKTGSIDCLVTHPSVIRCMIDYCVIAGAKKIILGDAPIQGADIDKFLQDNGYWKLVEFYRNNDVEVTIIDFRDLVVQVKNRVIVPSEKPHIGSDEIVEIDLGKLSYHANSNLQNEYATCGYTRDKINCFHVDKSYRHSYCLSKTVLSADLIINLPKPKTHRFAGITGAQKNFVGICPDKESLPHFRYGSKAQNGDESNVNSIFAKILSQVYERYLLLCKKGRLKEAFVMAAINSILERTKKRFTYSKGAWHGNDTIWRTILDINTLVRFSDKNGAFALSNSPRKILTIGDMIIVGEKNGPLDPSDKPLGIILAAQNCAAFDAVFCNIANYAYNLVPTIRESCNKDSLLSGGRKSVLVKSNLPQINEHILDECVFPPEWCLAPSPFWVEILSEKRHRL